MTPRQRSLLGLSELVVPIQATILEALQVIERGAEKIAFACDPQGRVVGSLTDGDIRRAVLAGAALDSRCLPEVMRADFTFVTPATGRAEVLDIMRARQLEELPVLDADGRLCGFHSVRRMLSASDRENCAVLLAGGRGLRLHPLTQTLPKPMVTVAGRPILERLVLHLMSCGVRRFFLSVNYLAHIIEEHFGDGSRFGCQIEYLRESEPLGTAGPLSLIHPQPSLPVVVLNGDLVTQCDVGRMLDFHQAGGYAATVGLRPYAIEIPFGVASVAGDLVTGLREKPTERSLINAGIYVLSPEIVSAVPSGREYAMTEVIIACLQRQLDVGAHILEDEWLDVGRPDELRRARGDRD